MTAYAVIDKVLLAKLLLEGVSAEEATKRSEVYRYSHTEPVEWNGMEFVTHDHVAQPEINQGGSIEGQAATINPAEWRIDIGAFFDRFGEAKLGILSSPNALVQAFITDVTVRKYIAIHERRAEIEAALNLLLSLGHQINTAAILDVKPTESEVWNG